MQSRFPKIHHKHLSWLMPLMLSGIMSGSISCFNLFINRGITDDFWSVWIHAWTLSWLIAFPLILIVLPLVRRFLMQFVHLPEKIEQDES
ncbi:MULTISPECIES: DUF2798 domain-containing protein [unclassified Acinetobacter]|uniref:DUF2798 domain-containing protein n=1 Tax=unclassified Acinetobacter TaxID=196816 RepID=UPI002934C799|nr:MULTISPECIES: DUF2798 domain-containing protein [unclassified Acinetobacter]WOE32689.1 DUF2798 domain-containing protein [Acinetobacter sp. SAAs470]WOE38165.1 DUF2798 domain-containing protein [Acinetobacter sp. SAAs474]